LLLSCEKVTQKHFHTAAPLGRQYESAFARSRGGCWSRLRLPAYVLPVIYCHAPERVLFLPPISSALYTSLS